VAPDLRGYRENDKPPAVADYSLDELARDAVALVEALGHNECALVGHDWGGAIGWQVAMRHPAVVRRLVAIAGPHPVAFARALLRDPAQRRRSAYMLAFQVPGLPERWLRGPRLARFLRSWAARPDALADEDLARYVEAFDGHPGAMRSALAYYRAAFRRPWRAWSEPPPVRAPTLVLWGERDPILGRSLLDDLPRYVRAPLRIEVVEGAGHFVQQEAPEAVNRALVAFLAGPGA